MADPITSVTKLGSIAENLSIGIENAVNWTTVSRALTSDNLHASAQLQGLGSKSNYLYIHGFNLNLPSTATIDGISVLVQKKGTGTAEDYYVGLIYPTEEDITITSPGQQLDGSWAISDTDYTYGSSIDLWGRPWTYSELNHSDFGFAISIEGNPANLDSGSIDYVEITVYYHNTYEESGSGGTGGFGGGGGSTAAVGVIASGTARTTFIDYEIPASAGCLLSGHGGTNIDESTSGGSICNGTADISNSYGVSGGITIAGSVNISVVHSFVPSGSGIISGEIIFQFFYNSTTAQGVILNSSSIPENYYLVLGGITCNGDSPINATFYTYLDDIPAIGYGVKTNGSAFIDPYIPTGGVVLNDSNVIQTILEIATSGGSICSGTSTIRVAKLTSGGILAAGESVGGRTWDIPDWSLKFSKSQVVPPVTSSGDISASYADIWFNKTTRRLSWKLDISGFDSGITGAGIYGPAYDGSNGSLVVDFGLVPFSGSTVLTTTQRTQLLSGQYYIIIKTVNYPSGEARAQIKSSGVFANGTSLVKPYREIASGGAISAGIAGLFPWIATGGSKLTGTSTVTTIYANTLSSEEYSLLASAQNSVPVDDNPYLALVYLRLNPTTRLLSWRVDHNLPGIDAIRIRGSANRSSTAGSIVSIDARSGANSPSIGFVTLGADEVALIQSGLTYFTAYDNDADEVIRVQIIKNDAYMSGTASVSLVNARETSGGATCAGALIGGIRWTFAPVGGVVFGGSVATAIFEKGKGGATIGSSAITEQYSYVISSGGSTVGSAGNVFLAYWHAVTGGVNCAGFNPPALTIPVSGGSVIGGTWAFQFIPTPPVSGGAKASPLHVLMQTYAASGIGNRGGIYAGGRGRTEKIKFFSNRRLGYGRAMASSNILTIIDDGKEKIMKPNESLVPVLDENRFRIRHNVTWCDPEERCSGVLPKITKNRQKGILPS